jgi:hypothetical protein
MLPCIVSDNEKAYAGLCQSPRPTELLTLKYAISQGVFRGVCKIGRQQQYADVFLRGPQAYDFLE